MENIRLTIEKLVFGGQALARTADGKVAFVWNALPGETVDAVITKKKKDYLEAIATAIITPAPDRISPEEEAYLSTSPWQMMTFDAEQQWKKSIAAETYSKFGDLILSSDNLDIVSDGRMYGYRNKMEFSFVPRLPARDPERAQRAEGPISLAFFERNKKNKLPVVESKLALSEINETAQHILTWINEVKIPNRSLKSIIVRSNGKGQTIAVLFLKDELLFETYPKLNDQLQGFELYYSTHRSPAAVPTKLLYTTGDTTLTASIKSCDLNFGALSFFQINIPVFEKALEDIAAFLDPKEAIVDLYGGVGAISLPLSLSRTSCTIVDSSNEGIEFAKQNIQKNNRVGCQALCAMSEDILHVIDSKKAVIVDPPRAGLHPKVIQRILTQKPPKIVYLSCGLDTQARDIRLLSESYKPVLIKLYNFFPRTPHIEGLIILERIGA